MSEMEILIELSHEYGSDPAFIVAGGGNTSAKVGGVLHVKASGHALAGIGPEGFVAMDRRALAGLLDRDLGDEPVQREERFKQAILAARAESDTGLRPSVECVLHNLMPGTFVVHTHPTVAGGLVCLEDGERLAGELFGDDVLWIRYIDPGFALAKVIARRLEEYVHRTGRACPAAILLQNHGMIVGGETADEVRRRTDRVIGAIRRRIDATPAENVFGETRPVEPDRAARSVEAISGALRAQGQGVVFDASAVVIDLVCGADGRRAVELGPLCPDQIVYCGSFPLWLGPGGEAGLQEAAAEHRRATGFAPKVVLAEGVGMFGTGAGEKSAGIAARMYHSVVEMMACARRLGAIRTLSDSERRFIEDWEVEAYRRKLATGE